MLGQLPWLADHAWAPMGPSFLWSTGGAYDVLDIVGLPVLLAYMALN